MNKDLNILTYNLKKDKYESFSRIFEEADEIFTLVRYNEDGSNSRMTEEYIILTYKYDKETKGVIENSLHFNNFSSLEEFLLLENCNPIGKKSLSNMIRNTTGNYEKEHHKIDSIRNYAQPLNNEEIKKLKELITLFPEPFN